MDPAPRTAAVEPPRAPAALVHGREDRLRVGHVHGQIDRAGVLVDEEHEFPVLAAVGGAVDAPLRVRSPQVPDRRHICHVRVARMDLDSPDVVRVLQPQVRPGAPRVGGAVDAVAPRRALPVVGLAGADPHHVRVGRRDGHGADRSGRFVPENVLEGDPRVLGLPHPAARDADVEGAGVGFDHRQLRDAPAHDGRADGAEPEGGGGARDGVVRFLLGRHGAGGSERQG